MLFTVPVIVGSSVTAFVTGITCACSYGSAKNKIKRNLEIRRMRKKIKKLLDDIEDKDPESLMNIVCETKPNPCKEGQLLYNF